MTVKMLYTHEVCTFNDAYAARLIEQGKAEPVEEKAEEPAKVEETAEKAEKPEAPAKGRKRVK